MSEMPSVNPENERLAALSDMTVELDGGRSNMSLKDQEALDDLIVEVSQAAAKAEGQLVKPTEVEPVDVRDAMAVDSEHPWLTQE